MGEQERVEPLDARLAQPPQDRAAGRAGVDEDRGAAVLEQRRVALADVEERDDELARAAAGERPGGRARQRGRATATMDMAAAGAAPAPAGRAHRARRAVATTRPIATIAAPPAA